MVFSLFRGMSDNIDFVLITESNLESKGASRVMDRNTPYLFFTDPSGR
jgi:hypothetical protein